MVFPKSGHARPDTLASGFVGAHHSAKVVNTHHVPRRASSFVGWHWTFRKVRVAVNSCANIAPTWTAHVLFDVNDLAASPEGEPACVATPFERPERFCYGAWVSCVFRRTDSQDRTLGCEKRVFCTEKEVMHERRGSQNHRFGQGRTRLLPSIPKSGSCQDYFANPTSCATQGHTEAMHFPECLPQIWPMNLRSPQAQTKKLVFQGKASVSIVVCVSIPCRLVADKPAMSLPFFDHSPSLLSDFRSPS